MPACCYGQIKERSSVANLGVITASGVVDSDFRGEISAYMINIGPEAVKFNCGDRICQIMIISLYDTHAEEGIVEDNTQRGTQGLGSTGK